MNLLNDIKQKKILVIGDSMLDIYYYGKVNRISPEAPVPIFRKTSEFYVLGGAANVAANLSAANQNVSLVSIVGDDANAQILMDLLNEKNIDTKYIIKTKHPTISKIRLLATGTNQQVLRLDYEDDSLISDDLADRIINCLEMDMYDYDLIVMSDYLKGLLSDYFTKSIISIANEKNIKVVVDVKDKDYHKYDNCFLLKPNKKELEDLTGLPVSNEKEMDFAAYTLLNNTSAKYVLVTRGAEGMDLYSNSMKYHVDAICKDVFDVTGAGDTTISYLAATLSNNIEICESVKIANYAAAVQVSKLGTTSVTIEEVQELFYPKTKVQNKVISLEELVELLQMKKNMRIVFTNGCFDILHSGHVKYLQEASYLGDVLVVGLNSDLSVKRLKGQNRPINCQEDRAEVLAALECVDYIVIFEEDTPIKLIESIKPNVLVKGGDYQINRIVGYDFVIKNGGEVKTINFVEGKSTTNLIEKIKE